MPIAPSAHSKKQGGGARLPVLCMARRLQSINNQLTDTIIEQFSTLLDFEYNVLRVDTYGLSEDLKKAFGDNLVGTNIIDIVADSDVSVATEHLEEALFRKNAISASYRFKVSQCVERFFFLSF